MSRALRPYQTEIVNQTRARMQSGVRSILIQSPTGSGKTLLTAHMLGTAASKGLSSWFIVHRRELVKQSVLAFAEEKIRFGVISAGFMQARNELVQIASIQTLAKRFERFKRPKLIVWDECHHLAAGSWAKIHAAFPDAFHIGLTATPARLDSTGLSKYFQEMINGPTVSWLIENKFLAPYKLFAPPSVNLTGLHTRMGDFITSELNAAVDKPTITGDAIKHYQKHAAGKRAVVFCVSVEHSKHVVSQFLAAGIQAAHVDGETPMDERDKAIRRFRDGEIKILSNVELFGEGFDLPSLEVAVLLRPTQSIGLYLQQVGRALRPSPGKEFATIFDHAGNCERHGLPDQERVWTLTGTRGAKGNSGSGTDFVKICPKCFAAQFPGRAKCSYCGHIFEVQGREVDQVEGELKEVDVEAVRRQRFAEQSNALSLTALIELGKKRGYKKPYAWAHHILQARQAKKLQRMAA